MVKTLGLIGSGYWGAILVKYFKQHPNFLVKYICDRNSANLEKIADLATHCELVNTPHALFADPALDVIVIATQAIYHFDLSMRALNAGKHIFVEKPFVLSRSEANTIFQLAKKQNKKVWVDHTFLFSAAYQKLKTCIQQGLIGEPLRFHSQRTGFGLFASDVNIMWHLMYHDIYLLLDLFSMPQQLSSVISSAAIIPNMSDSVLASLKYSSGLHATIHCDMLFAEKKREMVITGSQGILVWNAVHTDKLLFYPYTAKYHAAFKKVSYQLNEVHPIKVEEVDSLTTEVNAFSEFLQQNDLIYPSQTALLDVVYLLEAIVTKSREGKYVLL